MVDQKNNNPLRYIFAFYAIGVAINTVSFIQDFLAGSSLTEIILSNKKGVWGFLIMLLCVISYIQKKMLAWWMALLYFPIMFAYRTFEGHAVDRERIIAFALFSFAVYYIASKYSAYKEYINHGSSSKETGLMVVSKIL